MLCGETVESTKKSGKDGGGRMVNLAFCLICKRDGIKEG